MEQTLGELNAGQAAFPAPRLPLLRLELTFVIEEPVVLPPFRGHLWRGILGPALKRIDEGLIPGVSTGLIERGELYRTLFETPPPPDATKMRRYNAVPHPYVIYAPNKLGLRRLECGEEEQIGLTLVGRAATAAESVLAAFDFAARAGIGVSSGPEGGKRGRARLASVQALWRGEATAPLTVYDGQTFHIVDAVEPPVPPPPEKLRVLITTPLRLFDDERQVTATSFRPGLLVANLVRRVSMMAAFHGDTPHEPDFRRLKQLWESLRARAVMLADEGQIRWSSSQQRDVDMSGIIGSFVLDLRGAEALFPYLWLGQWLHAGKGTVMGMGAIRLRPER